MRRLGINARPPARGTALLNQAILPLSLLGMYGLYGLLRPMIRGRFMPNAGMAIPGYESVPASFSAAGLVLGGFFFDPQRQLAELLGAVRDLK